MSEPIEITVIVKKESRELQSIHVTQESGATLMSTLLKNKLISGNFCGGRGSCGRCRVRFAQAAPLPTSMERKAFTAEELREGYRLACMVRPKSSCVISLDVMQTPQINILTDMIGMSEGVDPLSHSRKAPSYLIAVDLGTTTIAMQLMDSSTGESAGTYCAMNPQRSYGADVLSRIQAANEGNAQILREAVWEVLQEGVRRFWQTLEEKAKREKTDRAEISCMCIAGNTAMEHILMGLSTETLGKSPFRPVELGLQECTLTCPDNISLQVYITPGISAFVGGDIVAGLYYCHLLDNFPRDSEGAALFIDLGTNGEMAVTDGRRMIATATAAGPAFEGGAGAALPGSDMIAVTAALLREGRIDETGLLAEPYFSEGVSVSPPGKTETILLTQKYIRDLQMAKAAVRAGIEILCGKLGAPEIARVYLAGGFGYYLDVDAAADIGLLPERLRNCTQAVGNASLAGAFLIGRDLCAERMKVTELLNKLSAIESINLAETEGFEKRYVSYLNFRLR